jgi:nitrate/nitrite-specific signal transduction histidine kinase
VTLEAHASALKLEVRDDGTGIAEEMERLDGMGLRIMSYRAGLIQGKLEKRRQDAGGTLVNCLVMKGPEHGSNNPQEPERG